MSVYKWDIEKSEWSIIGGTPDTIRNMIVIHIDSPGVCAAFTSTFVTHSEDGFSQNPRDRFNLSQNYPNPFNQATEIEFTIPETSEAKLDILNINGQLVRTLVNTTLSVGAHKIQWDSKDDLGNQVSGGVYLYRLTTNDYVETKSMILFK